MSPNIGLANYAFLGGTHAITGAVLSWRLKVMEAQKSPKAGETCGNDSTMVVCSFIRTVDDASGCIHVHSRVKM